MDLLIRTVCDKVLCNIASSFAKTLKYNGLQRGIASLTCKVFDKKSLGGDIKKRKYARLVIS